MKPPPAWVLDKLRGTQPRKSKAQCNSTRNNASSEEEEEDDEEEEEEDDSDSSSSEEGEWDDSSSDDDSSSEEEEEARREGLEAQSTNKRAKCSSGPVAASSSSASGDTPRSHALITPPTTRLGKPAAAGASVHAPATLNDVVAKVQAVLMEKWGCEEGQDAENEAAYAEAVLVLLQVCMCCVSVVCYCAVSLLFGVLGNKSPDFLSVYSHVFRSPHSISHSQQTHTGSSEGPTLLKGSESHGSEHGAGGLHVYGLGQARCLSERMIWARNTGRK